MNLKQSIALLAACPALAFAQGSVFVSSEKDHALSVLDIAKQEITGTVATCKRPRHMQVLPGG